MPPLTEDDIRPAAEFSNFAQKIKVKYWEISQIRSTTLPEANIDDLLLLAFDEFQHRQVELIKKIEDMTIDTSPENLLFVSSIKHGYNNALKDILTLLTNNKQ